MMNDRMKESLSALVDGEADELEIRRILNQAEQDDELRERWGRYQLIGAALRREPAYTTDLSKGILQALDGEPMDEVPGYPAESVEVPNETASTHDSGELVTGRSQRFGWLTSGAVAASVAMVVLLGARLTEESTDLTSGELARVETAGASAVNPVSTTPVLDLNSAPGGQLVSVRGNSNTQPLIPKPALPASALTEEELRAAQNKLRDYVMQHSEHAALNTGRGLMPFARVSNFESDDKQ